MSFLLLCGMAGTCCPAQLWFLAGAGHTHARSLWSVGADAERLQVALFSENGARWLVADQGIMMAGGVRPAVPPERVSWRDLQAAVVRASPSVLDGQDKHNLMSYP